MSVVISNTPNPNALKFTVGVPVGGPLTVTADSESDNPMAAELVAIDGVLSVFATADFVTLTKLPDADWESIAASARAILERYFGD